MDVPVLLGVFFLRIFLQRYSGRGFSLKVSWAELRSGLTELRSRGLLSYD